jgi:hypothetical protein
MYVSIVLCTFRLQPIPTRRQRRGEIILQLVQENGPQSMENLECVTMSLLFIDTTVLALFIVSKSRHLSSRSQVRNAAASILAAFISATHVMTLVNRIRRPIRIAVLSICSHAMSKRCEFLFVVLVKRTYSITSYSDDLKTLLLDG